MTRKPQQSRSKATVEAIIEAGIRAVLDTQMAARGSAALHADLAKVDPVTAARLAPGDTQRIQRAPGGVGIRGLRGGIFPGAHVVSMNLRKP